MKCGANELNEKICSKDTMLAQQNKLCGECKKERDTYMYMGKGWQKGSLECRMCEELKEVEKSLFFVLKLLAVDNHER